MAKMGVKGGMSMTTAFDVFFDFTGKSVPFADDFYDGDNQDVVTMLCDEAQLPNVQSATAQLTGRYLGEGPISYPHTKIYTDVSLGFLLDRDLTALKFFTSWYDFIFGENEKSSYDGSIDKALSAQPEAVNRTNRLRFSDSYTCNAKIIKTEMGGSASNQKAPIAFILENCYPYSIDAVPLSYGSSQITRVTVNLYYTRHTVSYGNKFDTSKPTVNGIQIGRDDPFAPVTPENP